LSSNCKEFPPPITLLQIGDFLPCNNVACSSSSSKDAFEIHVLTR